jgi:hypothetical protein
MTKHKLLIFFGIALVAAIGLAACTGGNRSNLKRLRYNKEMELRQNWSDYTVYKLIRGRGSWQPGGVAFIYKLEDKNIQLDRAWIRVTSDEMKARTKIMESVISAEIRGYNEELYGYIIYRSQDFVYVKILDNETVRLSYHYRRDYSN